MISEKIALREDVSTPAAKAAAGVERLAKTLVGLGNIEIDTKAAAKIEGVARASTKANERAAHAAERAAAARESLAKADEKARVAHERAAKAGQDAGERAAATAKKAAELREAAGRAEEKAREAAERAAKLRANGVNAEKADLLAANAAGKAARVRAAAERAETSARKAAEVSVNAQSVAESKAAKATEDAGRRRVAAKKAEDAASKLAGKAEKARLKVTEAREKAEAAAVKKAEKAEARRKKLLDPKMSKTEARLSEQVRSFNPDQVRREMYLQRQLDQMRAKATKGLGPASEDEDDGGLGGFGKLSGKGKAAALAVVAAAAAVARAAGRAGLDFGAAAVRAQAFREDSTRALKILRQSKGDADEAFSAAMRTADFIGQGREETLRQYVTLIGQFEDRDFVDKIIRSSADLASVNPEANIDGIVRAMGKIQATGYLQGDELNMLTEAGLPALKVYEKLAVRMGKTVDEVKKLRGTDKLQADLVNPAILDAMNELGGNQAAGLAARAKSLQNISGIMQRLEAVPGNLLMDLEVTPGMRSFKGFLAGTVASLDDVDRRKRIIDVLSKSLNSAMGTVFSGRNPAAIIDAFVSKLETMQPMVSAAFSGFRTGLESALGMFDKIKIFDNMGPLAQIRKALGIQDVPWVERMAKGIGLIAGMAGFALAVIGTGGAIWVSFWTDAYAVVLNVYGAVAGIAEKVENFARGLSLFGDGEKVGGSLVAGLTSGIGAHAAEVSGAVRSLATGTIGATKKAFGVASPAKPFIEIGGFVSKGAEVGINAGAAGVIRSAERMALAATDAASLPTLTPQAAGVVASRPSAGVGSSTARAVAVDGGAKTVINVQAINVIVQGGKGAEQDGQAVANAVWDMLRRLAEKG